MIYFKTTVSNNTNKSEKYLAYTVENVTIIR